MSTRISPIPVNKNKQYLNFRFVDKFPLTGKCLKRVDMFLKNRLSMDMFLNAFL